MSTQAKVALVTGAGSGIGRRTAVALMVEGYSVVLAGRKREALEETANEGKQFSPQTLVVPTDVRDASSVRLLFERTRTTFGRLDLLFNNAGIAGAAAPLEDVPFDQWSSVLATNLTGAFLCTQEAFHLMKSQSPQGGRIINNGSLSAHTPRPNSVAYVASKHAITGLTKSTALEGRRYNIACGQIDIGNAATAMVATMQPRVPQASGAFETEPTMDPEHAARTVVYMAGLPLDANVLFLTVMATKMPFVGRG